MLQPSTTLNHLDLFTIKVLHASLLAITAAAMLVMVVVHGASFFNQANWCYAEWGSQTRADSISLFN
jgi:hypothetical protein